MLFGLMQVLCANTGVSQACCKSCLHLLWRLEAWRNNTQVSGQGEYWPAEGRQLGWVRFGRVGVGQNEGGSGQWEGIRRQASKREGVGPGDQWGSQAANGEMYKILVHTKTINCHCHSPSMQCMLCLQHCILWTGKWQDWVTI